MSAHPNVNPAYNALHPPVARDAKPRQRPWSDAGQALAAVIGPSAFLAPRHVDLFTEAPWMEHAPFALWLTDVLRPDVFVELGTHTGFSYFTVCQAVRELRLHTRCYAVDNWIGDSQAGFYGEEVFARVKATNREQYANFSQLIRASFDEALAHFSDGEIDLLHIDGRHGYDDVKGDFERWRAKLSARGVALFHDTNVREDGFGVWRFWQELAGRYPSFEFVHGYGLGLVAVGRDLPGPLCALLEASAEEAALIRAAYAQLGAAVSRQRALLQAYSELGTRDRAVEQLRTDAEQRIARLDEDRQQLARRAAQAEAETAAVALQLAAAQAEAAAAAETVARLQERVTLAEPLERRATRAERERDEALRVMTRLKRKLVRAERERDAIRDSTIWQATGPLRAVLGLQPLRPLRAIVRRVVTRGSRAPELLGDDHTPLDLQAPQEWFAWYRLGADHHAIRWRGSTTFSIVMPVYKVRLEWLAEAIASVRRQTYPHWELICIDDHSENAELGVMLRRAEANDGRVRTVTLERNQGISQATNIGIAQATGEYVLFLDHDDMLEPHALARLADAAFAAAADILYGDEVVTGESADDIQGVQARPTFSHSYYLAHPYFVHPVAVRTELARQVGGLDVGLAISQDVDFVLRALEVAKKVTHVPDILYRWRTSTRSAGHAQQAEVMAATCAAKTAHLRRLGFAEAEVRAGPSFNTFRVRYFGAPAGRVLGIVPTKNQTGLLRRCLESVRATTAGVALDLVVVDHQSDDPETQEYLRALEAAGTARVLHYAGAFNFSAINNLAVATCGAGYDDFLFLNNDIEAIEPGWLGAMMDLAMRQDVGAVGATLLFPDRTVQHAGVIVGLYEAAEHAFKSLSYRGDEPGYGAGLHATREYCAVTAACMLVPAEVFRAVKGFDERLKVGFNDTDLCLRIGQQGYRILNCGEAVLMHHESVSRGKGPEGYDPHPRDSALFRSRYKRLLREGDPHFSPLLGLDNTVFGLRSMARLSRTIRYRSQTDFLPRGRRGAPVTRPPVGGG
jgi:GT2 family glycosyltransferase